MLLANKWYTLKASAWENIKEVCHISKLFMPPDSTDRLLTAPVRAARISRRHSHSVSCQEPVRRSLGPPGPPGPIGTPGPPGTPGQPRPPRPPRQPGPPGPPGQSGTPGPPGQSGLSVLPGQSGQSGQLKNLHLKIKYINAFAITASQ